MIDGIVNSGAMPALELAIGYASARQKLLAHNIANLSTPDFVQKDVDPGAFQQFLRSAVQERRERAGTAGGLQGELRLPGSREIEVGSEGITLHARENRGGVMFHDRNNRDLERLMQDMAENASAYRVAIDLMRSQTEIMKAAISQRA